MFICYGSIWSVGFGDITWTIVLHIKHGDGGGGGGEGTDMVAHK